jgi:hypothetical protein
MVKSLVERVDVKSAKSRQRSRISNGTAFLPGHIDGRSPWVRRAKDLVHEFIGEQLGGPDNCSPAERCLARRASALIVECEILESKFATNGEGTPAQLYLYQRLVNTLRRALEALGLGRRPRDVTPTLGELIRQDQLAERQRLANEHEQQEAAS